MGIPVSAVMFLSLFLSSSVPLFEQQLSVRGKDVTFEMLFDVLLGPPACSVSQQFISFVH
jgi:hypothetical protein